MLVSYLRLKLWQVQGIQHMTLQDMGQRSAGSLRGHYGLLSIISFVLDVALAAYNLGNKSGQGSS